MNKEFKLTERVMKVLLGMHMNMKLVKIALDTSSYVLVFESLQLVMSI